MGGQVRGARSRDALLGPGPWLSHDRHRRGCRSRKLSCTSFAGLAAPKGGEQSCRFPRGLGSPGGPYLRTHLRSLAGAAPTT